VTVIANTWFQDGSTNVQNAVGLTRRGQGQSDKPASGYDTDSLAEDIRLFLDTLAIDRAILVGHSHSGGEMTRFAGLYPDRVSSVIYLDAAYDPADEPTLMATAPIPFPAPSEQDLCSIDAYRAWLKRCMFGSVWCDALDANLISTIDLAPNGTWTDRMSDAVAQALVKGAIPRPDYSAIRAPTLAIFAIKSEFPGIGDQDSATQAKVEAWMHEVTIPFLRRAAQQFRERVPHGRVVELADTNHYCFIVKPVDVAREMWAFLTDIDQV
jgi:pimeloyl-ACP methyl ester carboxylesterase